MNTIECNQRCTKCSHWKYKDKADRLPPEKLIKGIKSIPTVKELCIVGGEPLLFKSELYEILEGIAITYIRTVIITNGVLMDEKFIHEVSKYNIHIVISIDTLDREFWKFVRGTNSYDRGMKNLESAISILKPSQISIQSILSKETQPYLAAVANYANTKGIHHSIQDYMPEGFEGSWTATEKTQAMISDIGQQCFAANRNLSVVQNGDVYTCFQQPWIDECQKPLGNLNSQKMPEILSSEYAITVGNKMKSCNLPCKVLKCNTKN